MRARLWWSSLLFSLDFFRLSYILFSLHIYRACQISLRVMKEYY